MHEQACLVNPPRASAEPLVVNTAGNCCVGWTAEGKRARHSHESQHPFYVWLCQRRELALREQEDLFLQECTPQFDILSCMISPLQDSHLVVHAVIGPRMLGWPTSRDRRLSCGLNLKSLVWLGPSSTQEIQQDFERFFRRRCCLTGDVFFQSDPDATRAWVKSVMQKTGAQQSQPLARTCVSWFCHLVSCSVWRSIGACGRSAPACQAAS